jgi:hypothetical protein
MNILTIENVICDLNHIPEELDDDIRFAILDNNNLDEPDFYFVPLIIMESFNSPAVVLDIAGRQISMPIDNISSNWSILIGCSEGTGQLEIIPLTSLNDRGFEAFIFNPINGFRPEYGTIEIVNIYNDVKWYFPRIKNNQLLAVPIENKPNPLCAFFGKDIGKNYETIDITRLL